MAKGLWIVLAATATALTAPLASAQTSPAPSAATPVAPLTVQGPKPGAPWKPAEDPVPVELRVRGSELCNVIVQDPFTRALVAVGGQPRAYEDTRYPRNPDWNAPALTPKGSPYPAALSMGDYMKGDARAAVLSSANTAAGDLSADAGGYADNALDSMMGCLAGFAPGSDFGMNGRGRSIDQSALSRIEIKMRDEALPVAFALMDHGRWEEALTEFKAAYRKLPDFHGGDEAALQIGKIYLFGLGDKADPAEGVIWLKRVAEARFDAGRQMPRFYPAEPERNTAMGEAAMILAEVYRTGRGPVAKDPARSRRYLERAYALGHIPAAMALGEIYYNGVNTPKDLNKAFAWYMKAAVFQHAPADVAVARMYASGEAGGGADRIKALAWYAQAAKLNYPEALHALAMAFDRGEGVVPDAAIALNLYKRAAVAGDPAAQAAIGTYFYEGATGVPRDLAVARRWFERAALGGDADGMFNLAAMQTRGEGGAVDRVKAWGWLKIADKLGHANAGPAVRALEAQLTPQEQAGVRELRGAG